MRFNNQTPTNYDIITDKMIQIGLFVSNKG